MIYNYLHNKYINFILHYYLNTVSYLSVFSIANYSFIVLAPGPFRAWTGQLEPIWVEVGNTMDGSHTSWSQDSTN